MRILIKPRKKYKDSYLTFSKLMRLFDACFVVVLFSTCFHIILIHFRTTVHGNLNAWWIGPLWNPFYASSKLVQNIKDWKISAKITYEMNWIPQMCHRFITPTGCWKSLAEKSKILMSGERLSIPSTSFVYVFWVFFDLPAV